MYYDSLEVIKKYRRIYLFDSVNEKTAQYIIDMLNILNIESKQAPIYLLINSPGGDVYSMWAIVDTIRTIDAPVYTINVGIAASAASIILISGDVRKTTPNSVIMLHQPRMNASGTLSDVVTIANEGKRTLEQFVALLKEKTKLPDDKIEMLKNNPIDLYISPEQALEYKIIDEIVKYKKN